MKTTRTQYFIAAALLGALAFAVAHSVRSDEQTPKTLNMRMES